jgi:hypothetical protein
MTFSHAYKFAPKAPSLLPQAALGASRRVSDGAESRRVCQNVAACLCS